MSAAGAVAGAKPAEQQGEALQLFGQSLVLAVRRREPNSHCCWWFFPCPSSCVLGVSSGVKSCWLSQWLVGSTEKPVLTPQGCRDFLARTETTSLGRLFGSTMLSHIHASKVRRRKLEDVQGCPVVCGSMSCSRMGLGLRKAQSDPCPLLSDLCCPAVCRGCRSWQQ